MTASPSVPALSSRATPAAPPRPRSTRSRCTICAPDSRGARCPSRSRALAIAAASSTRCARRVRGVGCEAIMAAPQKIVEIFLSFFNMRGRMRGNHGHTKNLEIFCHFSTCATQFCGSNIRDILAIFKCSLNALFCAPVYSLPSAPSASDDQTDGLPWWIGSISNAVWGGALLYDVLRACGVRYVSVIGRYPAIRSHPPKNHIAKYASFRLHFFLLEQKTVTVEI